MKKEHIINEIIRTTKENNGIAMGHQKFLKETGIKRSDWYGKYWTRWSDAIREAGFKPNKMQAPYDENYIIERVISLIREIKKYPTTGDFRMKAYQTHDFPAHNTIHKLGRKDELVKKIVNYCKNQSRYQDVIKICSEVITTFEEKVEDDFKETDFQFGYVYLMKSGRYYKIGRSNFVERRNYELGTKLPEDLKIIHKIRTDDPGGIESYWHNRFEGKRKKGEWFDLSPGDVKAFKRRKFM